MREKTSREIRDEVALSSGPLSHVCMALDLLHHSVSRLCNLVRKLEIDQIGVMQGLATFEHTQE
jgi:hypothetical protein